MSFNIPFASGGSGRNMLMPEYIRHYLDVSIKTGESSTDNSSTAGFYSKVQTDFSTRLMDTATLQVTADTTEQTIIDTGTGKQGVLTQILSTRLSLAGDITIRVTADGILTTFTRGLSDGDNKLCIGDFANWLSSGTVAQQYGGQLNPGYDTVTNLQSTMLTPEDSASKGLPFGIVFEDSLKVTIQGSVSLLAGSSTHKAVAAWLTYIPEGL